MDLAKPTRKNNNERYNRSQAAAADRVSERDRDRRHIVLLLGDLNIKKHSLYTAPLSEGERNKYGFRKCQSERTIEFYGPLHSHQVSYTSETAAVLDRGEQFARISATRGWVADALPPDDKTMPTWINRVYYIASTTIVG